MQGAGAQMRQLAEQLAAAAAASSQLGAGPAGVGSPGGAAGQGLQFHRNPSSSPAVSGSTPGRGGGGPGPAPAKRSPARRGEALPKLKTRAIPGASLRQPGDGGSPTIPALPAPSGSPGGLQRERSQGGVPWGMSATADRHSESMRDAVRVAHMAKWQGS